MTPQQMFMLMQMQQAGKVAPTPTPKIAQGPTPVQIKPAPEIQIQQKPQTEAEKFKQAAKMAALNAGMNNAFQAGPTTAAMTNPMAAPLVMASMLFKEGDKVPDYEQKTFRGEPIDWSNPWEYVGMDKQTAMDPSSEFSTKFARKMGGQDFSTEGPGVGYDTYIPELDMSTGLWQKYGYDYGKIREMFLDNPDNRTSLNYQAFLWSHMSPAQKIKAIQEGGLFSGFAIKDLQETGKDEAWKKYVPQDIQFDGPFDPMGPKPEGMTDDEWNWWRWSEPVEEIPFSDDGRWDPDLYYSKGNKVKKPGYYAEGEEVEGGTPWWKLGPLARLFGKFGKPTEPMVEAKPPPTPDDPRFGRGRSIPSVTSDPGEIAQWRLNKIVKEHNTPSTFMEDFEKKLAKMSKEQRKRFWANWDKLDREGQINWLNAREAEFNRELRNRKMKDYIKSLENEKDIKTFYNSDKQKNPFKASDIKLPDINQLENDTKEYNRAMDKWKKGMNDDLNKGVKSLEKLIEESKVRRAKLQKDKLYPNIRTSDGTPIRGSDKLFDKDTNWNKFKRGFAKFAAPLTGPWAGPLGAAATLLDVQPLNSDETPEAVQKARELQAAAWNRNKDGPIIPKEEQEYLMRKAFIEENNPQPVYKQHGGGTFDLEKVLNYIPVQYKPTAFNQARPFMDQPYFQNVDSGSNNNPSFTDQVMGGNVNLWGPLSLDWNHGFGGQFGVGMDVPIMGGRPQWQ